MENDRGGLALRTKACDVAVNKKTKDNADKLRKPPSPNHQSLVSSSTVLNEN